MDVSKECVWRYQGAWSESANNPLLVESCFRDCCSGPIGESRVGDENSSSVLVEPHFIVLEMND